MHNVDIIIPIYNALEDLKLCLESLYKHTDLEHNRLILINDNSSDETIRPFLDQQSGSNIIVIHNEVNKGFSNNINIGMGQSDTNDVILLNSDTIVTSGWVEKMVRCAYSSEEIGTVTPLSNNATLCSVPQLFSENTLPEGMDIDRAAVIVEQCSLHKYPQITVANGFCMLVKREVIKLIGDFDAETFGRGYGEENDFCNRAEQMGYINVMCDDTYIYHSGTKSFVSKEKEKYIMDHAKILYDRYPEQVQANDKHVTCNPNRLIGENIGRFWAVNNGKKNILYVVQSDFRKGSENCVGGTQMHVKHLTEGLKSCANIFVAARNGRYLQVTAYIEDKEYTYCFGIGDKAAFFRFRDRRFAKVFKEIYTAFRIDLVHIHHLLTMSLDAVYEADKLNIPVVFTAHDFWSICPNISLRSHSGSICMKEGDNNCRECLAACAKIYDKNDYIKLWREQFHNALRLCRVVVVPSESTRDILGNYYPDLKDRIRVIYHGLDIKRKTEFPNEYSRSDKIKLEDYKIKEKNENLVIQGRVSIQDSQQIVNDMYVKAADNDRSEFWIPVFINYDGNFLVHVPVWRLQGTEYVLTFYVVGDDDKYYEIAKVNGKVKTAVSDTPDLHVAFIGGISDLKGAREIKRVIENSDDNIRWFIMGDIGDAELFYYQNRRLTKLQKYKQESLSLLLEAYQIDVIGILSIWPETFSYTLSEAIQTGRPVFVSDIGALGERVRKLGGGRAVSLENLEEEVSACLKEWINNKDQYRHDKDACGKNVLKTQAEMCQEYHALYEECYDQKEKSNDLTYDKDFIWDGMAAADVGENAASQGQMSAAELNYIQAVQNSITWRIVMKLIYIKFPFKDKIYRFLMNRR